MIEDEGVWSLRDMRAAMKRTLWLAGLRFVEGFLTAGWVQLVLALPPLPPPLLPPLPLPFTPTCYGAAL